MKTYRKLLAWLLTLVMLIGMMPVASAERLSDVGTFNCNHNWKTRWPNGAPANCLDCKPREDYCTICGATGDRWEEYGNCQVGNWQWVNGAPTNCEDYREKVKLCKICGEEWDSDRESGKHQWKTTTTENPTCTESGYKEILCVHCGSEQGNPEIVPPLGHNWGSWVTDVAATCKEGGTAHRTCKRCGITEDNKVAALGHDWTDWYVKQPATCTEQGIRQMDCVRCGTYSSNYTDPLGHNMSEWAVLIAPAVGVAGLEERHCLNNCGLTETRELPPLEGEMDISGPTLTLSLSSTPANGTHFVVGEEVTFTESWVNNTEYTLDPFHASIWTTATPVYGSEVDRLVSRWFSDDGPVVPGASGSHSLTVTVTEADVACGAIYAMAELSSAVQNGVYLEDVHTPFVTAPCGPDDSGDFGLSACLSVTKEVTSTPANGSYYEPGETVTYQVYVQNNGEQLNDLDVSDWMWGDSHAWEGTFAAGATVSYPVTYTVTDADARAEHVNNIACVTAIDKDGNQITEYSNLVTVPCGFPEGDDPYGIFHSLSLFKREESLPMNGEFYTEGEVIHYSITYTNDGELPLTDVRVWDNLNINTEIGHAEMLQPGESRTCYYQHTVTAADVDAGGVLNLAQAAYPVPGGEGTVGVNSNLVFSKTSIDGMHCIVLPPLFPEGDEDPEYDPGTGWFPTDDPIIEGDTPPFGTIDTDTLRNGESYCVRAITGRDNVSADYETTFCSVHSPMQSAALMMAQAAAAPETQMQAAAYAVTLWRAEVEKLHQEIYEAADPAAKMVVMTEFIRFMTEAANFETMLNMLYPDQPALVAQKVAAMWENKCIDLCYDMHATAADRKDSLLAVTPAVGAVSESCSCEVTAQENGKKNEKQSYCPVHGFPFSMIDALLQGNDTAERWTMVRQIWGVELTSAYNNVYTAMGDNKLLAMAEYNALTQWMMAREAYLIALYPENPEIVVQIMVKTIMERVNVLCEMFN